MHCTTSISWYIGKFTVNFLSILFVYYGFLKEKDVDCICGAGARDLARRKSGKEKPRSRCICKHWRKSIYPCGCKKNTTIEECAGKNWSVSHDEENVEKIKKLSCCCGK